MDYYKIEKNLEKEIQEKFNYPNRKIGVIVHIEDKDGKTLLQQRGKKSRDENGLYEDVGGKVEEEDFNYKKAMIREMREEMGEEARIQLSDAIGVYHCNKNDVNWVFVIFFGLYIEGKIKIMEPDKCIVYHFFEYEELMNSKLVTESCKHLTKSLKNHHT